MPSLASARAFCTVSEALTTTIDVDRLFAARFEQQRNVDDDEAPALRAPRAAGIPGAPWRPSDGRCLRAAPAPRCRRAPVAPRRSRSIAPSTRTPGKAASTACAPGRDRARGPRRLRRTPARPPPRTSPRRWICPSRSSRSIQRRSLLLLVRSKNVGLDQRPQFRRDRGAHAEPAFEAGRRLMQQHAKPFDGAQAARARRGQQRRLQAEYRRYPTTIARASSGARSISSARLAGHAERTRC